MSCDARVWLGRNLHIISVHLIQGTNPYVTCATQDAINNYIANNPKTRIQLYFANSLIDAVNYQTPTQGFIDNMGWLISPASALGQLLRTCSSLRVIWSRMMIFK